MSETWTKKKEERMLELEEKNSFGLDPRLTDKEAKELQSLLDELHDWVGA